VVRDESFGFSKHPGKAESFFSLKAYFLKLYERLTFLVEIGFFGQVFPS
jgi:hypothetical protein